MIEKYHGEILQESGNRISSCFNSTLEAVICALQIQKVEGKILITSVIDNLLKGAAGQAIQNMNIMFDLPENTGLAFKANYF